MEPGNNTSSGSAPRPQSGTSNRPVQPIVRRPVVDGFVAHRPQSGMRPVMHSPSATSAGTPALSPRPQAQSHAQPVSRPVQPQPGITRPAAPNSLSTTTSTTSSTATQHSSSSTSDDQSPAKSHGPREKNRTGHAGLVGFIVFILLGALLASPLLPGKIMDSLPLSSTTYSTGDSSLDCLGKQGSVSSTTKYSAKAGSPITYTSATTTTQTATCDGQPQSATVGRTSQFNILGLVTDVVVALVVAIVFARVWRLIFGEKRHPSRHRDE